MTTACDTEASKEEHGRRFDILFLAITRESFIVDQNFFLHSVVLLTWHSYSNLYCHA